MNDSFFGTHKWYLGIVKYTSYNKGVHINCTFLNLTDSPRDRLDPFFLKDGEALTELSSPWLDWEISLNFETDGDDKTDFNVGEFDKFDRFKPTEKSKINGHFISEND